MTAWVADWRNKADQHLANGELSVEEHSAYVERTLAGAVDGIAAGRAGRPWTDVPEAPRDMFRPYRRGS